MEGLIFDTTFLIDFQRERKRGRAGAHAFLEQNRACLAYLPMVAYGEFAEGFSSLSDRRFLSVVGAFELCPVTTKVAEVYSRICFDLRAKGGLIGNNDLWIAATAVEINLPLVTRNLDHFSRVDGLALKAY
ncbi:MAG: type II toxin-antitoxin system VapC family toxin [Puniceicoccaceae bacterium]|nr:MAG: type II toxin-antitoxin system VapC family toxin [Puniceicoccaceae bacterium]